MLRTMAAAMAALGLMGAAPADWRPVDPENTLVIETTKGRVIVELRPEFAPRGVARIKQLARDGVYDGLQFHRVIDGFVAQTGNPDNRDGGTSALPDLPPEFSFRVPPKRRPSWSSAAMRARALSVRRRSRPSRRLSRRGRETGACGPGEPTAPALSGWVARPIRAAPTASSSSCVRPPAGWTTNTRSLGGW